MRISLLAILLPILFSVALFAAPAHAQSRSAANVLYSDGPLPIYLGVELGTGLSWWQHSTPVYFATDFPYTYDEDTIHVWFPDGAKPLFGFFVGVTIDVSLTQAWGVIGKINYNERRGNWTGTSQTLCDMTGGLRPINVDNDLTWMLRCVSMEAELRYGFASLNDLYVGAGGAATVITSDHYDLNQSIDGPPECTFLNLSTGASTGIRAYGIGRSIKDQLATTFVELKGLVGYPFYLSTRWRLDPQVTLGYALTPVFNADARAGYTANGVPSPPKPLTVTGLLSLRYQIR
jgi:hypothetical protein